MAIANRDQLKEHALRALGAPVLEINVDDTQLEDRLDEALDYFNLYHYEGVEQMYLKHRIQASTIDVLAGSATVIPSIGEHLVGATSGAMCEVVFQWNRQSTLTLWTVRNVSGDFVVGENLDNADPLKTGTWGKVGAGGVTLGEVDLKYLTVPDWVYGVTKVLNIGQASSSKNMFDLQYQLRLNDLYDLTSTSIVYYKTVMNHLAMLDLELNGHPLYRFNRMQNRLNLDVNWNTDVLIGDHILIQGYRGLDPSEFTRIYNEPWLRLYVAALFKKQWGTNLKKFTGIALPGGVTLDGDKIYLEAIKEIEELEEELRTKSAPLDFFLG
jgi:hypothetical protein